MKQKEIKKYIQSRLKEFHSGKPATTTPPADLRRGGQDWWSTGPDIALKHWYNGDDETSESCRKGYELFVSQGISHIRLYGRPYDPEQTRGQSFDQRYIQYVNAAGEVIDEEEC